MTMLGSAVILALINCFTPPVWDFTGFLDEEFYGEKRMYHVILPPEYKKRPRQSSFPALVMLHGAGNNASVFAALTGITRIAPARGYVMIFPEGVRDLKSILPTHERTWNAGSCCGQAVLSDVDDITFLKAVLAHATGHFKGINTQQIFLSGASNGGSLVIRAACEMGKEYFAAAADVGSMESVNGEQCAGELRILSTLYTSSHAIM
jgi:polyhydroxybutyrate depolymerase